MTDEQRSYHVGWPQDARHILDRAKRGLPVYWPTSPAASNQAPYLDYLEREEGPK